MAKKKDVFITTLAKGDYFSYNSLNYRVHYEQLRRNLIKCQVVGLPTYDFFDRTTVVVVEYD